MNVLIKRLAIGGVLYAVAETSFIFGKGIMLGILKGYDVSALLEILQNTFRPHVK